MNTIRFCFTSYCPHCRQIEWGLIEPLMATFPEQVSTVNLEESPAVARKYKIDKVPVLLATGRKGRTTVISQMPTMETAQAFLRGERQTL